MTFKIKNIKTIFLDWNGTICNDLFWGQLNNSNTKHIFDQIINSLFIKNKHMLSLWMKGSLDITKIIKKINSETNINKKYLKKELIFSVKNMKFINPEIPKTIKLIQKKNIKVVLASGNMDVFQYAVKKLYLNLIFDKLLLSNEVGFEKQEVNEKGTSLFFDKYLIDNNLKYKECVLIDDSKSLTDFVNKTFGMQSIHIKKAQNTIHELRKFL